VNEIIRNQVPFVGLNESEVKTGSISFSTAWFAIQAFKKAYPTGRFQYSSL
jgi:hypothetical protein